MIKFWLVAIALLCLAVIGIYFNSEILEVEATSKIFVRKAINAPDNLENKIGILNPGQRAMVIDCVNNKSDIALKIQYKNTAGYISDGDFILHAKRPAFNDYHSHLSRISFFCSDFFLNRRSPTW